MTAPVSYLYCRMILRCAIPQRPSLYRQSVTACYHLPCASTFFLLLMFTYMHMHMHMHMHMTCTCHMHMHMSHAHAHAHAHVHVHVHVHVHCLCRRHRQSWAIQAQSSTSPRWYRDAREMTRECMRGRWTPLLKLADAQGAAGPACATAHRRAFTSGYIACGNSLTLLIV